ncbi:Fibronectin type III domain protein [Thiorhodococcus drewsii AZ1]|uniref:Fibronectin type III domain protein n=1 Tax=Thiorhodococcus drewsii AZ1 TaxID=765913 RepID=G2E3L7_9GAMM|nr:FG-GAP-like repeat-containing protein [Thiorhodococcus drewsii]EGV30130.1 Fibronectin type III domain protein [Thiorhodococcus drewsii AZ1]
MNNRANYLQLTCFLTTALASTIAASQSNSITLEWDPVDDARVTHYELYYGTQTGDYESPPIELDKNTTTYIFSDLDPFQVYYFSIKATDGQNEASDFSNEITSGEFRYVLGAKAGDGEAGWVEIDDKHKELERTLSVTSQRPLQIEGDSRVAVGDIDGDGRDEVVIGYAARDGRTPLEGSFQVLDDDFSVLAWGTVSWPEYNSTNGETYPAIGDIDGDGRDEIVIGLGTGGLGMMEVFDYKNGALTSIGWTTVDWPEYFAAGGKTFPALGDIDGDGKDDLVVGFSEIEGNPDMMPGGVFVVQKGLSLDESALTAPAPAQGVAQNRLLQASNMVSGDLTWSSYASRIGETRPTLGDIDGDGLDEIIIGLAPAGDGLVEIFDYQSGTLVSIGAVGVAMPDYNLVNGETRPAVGDVDLDGRGEILVGLGTGSHGIIGMLDDAKQGFVSMDSFQGNSYSVGYEDAGFWPVLKRERTETPAKTTTTQPKLRQ